MSPLVVLVLVTPLLSAQYLREPLPVLDEPPSYAEDEVSQTALFEAQHRVGDVRLIEPTSPVLGNALVTRIRQDPRHPDEILRAIDVEFPTWRRAVLLSVHAYARAMTPALARHDESTQTTTVAVPPSEVTLVEHAAIPLEILLPQHATYASTMRVLVHQAAWIAAPDHALQDAARTTTEALRAKRRALADEGALLQTLETMGAMCPGVCGDFIDANLRIASAEDSFPRLQYSVNGFTGFVFRELMARDDLVSLLRVVYDAESEWLSRAEQGDKPARALVESIIEAARTHGYVPREVILALAFSTRNMPSVDFQYADDPTKALALEVYFWKFRQMRDVLVRRHLSRMTDQHPFTVNPGVYHFTTAGLHACELQTAGFPNLLGVGAATSFKVAYKTQKLLYGIDVGAFAADPIFYVPTRMREQGYMTGVEAGFYGGRLGVEFCGPALETTTTSEAPR